VNSVNKQLDLLQGTLDMLILKAVSLGPLHGYGCCCASADFQRPPEIQQGSLYPALYRLEHQAGSRASGANRKTSARPNITAHRSGETQIADRNRNWNRMASVMAGILGTKPEEV